MITLTKPSTAQCTLPAYISFLLSEPKSTTCTRLSEIFSYSVYKTFLKIRKYFVKFKAQLPGLLNTPIFK